MREVLEIYLVRFEWTDDNNNVNSQIILTHQISMEKATRYAIKQFETSHSVLVQNSSYRISWVENIMERLLSQFGLVIYSTDSFGLHDPFCSSNRGQT